LFRLVFAAACALLLALGVSSTPANAAPKGIKVVVVVGPVADHNAHYKSDADQIAAEARKFTSNVVELLTPNATWQKVKSAAQGASIFV